MAYPESWLHELLSKNDIVSVASEYTQLSAKGGRLWGHCPFHSERNPSFSVSPDKQLFHCFSCKAGGSVIQLVMQAESLTYTDAVRHLAQRVNMDMPEEIDDSRLLQQKHLRERIYAANREAAMYYHKQLLSPDGEAARDYVARRGVDSKTLVRFGLGYSPDSWDALFVYLTDMGFSRDELIKAGLASVGRKDSEKTFDFFRNRLMFPVISAAGKVIAFGGRALGNDEPKYINTGDTPVYNKRENIYAINLLKGASHSDVIMVEGYMDVISLHQRGVTNAVASLGTALTTQQARLLKRFASKVYYAYDGDEAGQKAMLRGIDVLASVDVEPRVIIIPDGLDPDDYIRSFGADSFLLLKDSSITSVRFKIERIASVCGLDDPDGREKFAKQACALLSRLEPVERDRYIALVAEKSGLAAQTIKQQCGVAAEASNTDDGFTRRGGYKAPHADTLREKSECILAACLMKSASDAQTVCRLNGFSLELFSNAALKSFCADLLAAYKRSSSIDIGLMIAALDAPAADAPAAALAMCDSIINPAESAADTIAKLTRTDDDKRLNELAVRIQQTSDTVKRAELWQEYVEIQHRNKNRND